MNVITTANCGNPNGCVRVDWLDGEVFISLYDSQGSLCELYLADVTNFEMLMEANRKLSNYAEQLGLWFFSYRGATSGGVTIEMLSLKPHIGFRAADDFHSRAELQCWMELLPPESPDCR